MRALIAFDKFKDSISAEQACQTAADALRARFPDWMIDSAPLTDGGEGFVRILAHQAGGKTECLQVCGPRFEPIEAEIGWVHLDSLPESVAALLEVPTQGKLAIIEMAQASGLQSLPKEQRDPWHTTTFGTGELIRHAAESGAEAILLGIGGSATNDLGMGALEALGLRAYDHTHQPVSQLTPAKWTKVCSLGGLVNSSQKLPPLRIACDVTNPLLGERGATSVFGPQKGLNPVDQSRFERLMRKTADRLLGLFGHDPASYEPRRSEPGAGAAGGIGFGLRTALADTRFVPGFDLVTAWLRLEEKKAAADVILTGEGCFDEASLEGKGPGTILKNLQPHQAGYLFAGSVAPSVAQIVEKIPGLKAAVSISPDDWPLEQSLKETPELLRSAIEKTVLFP